MDLVTKHLNLTREYDESCEIFIVSLGNPDKLDDLLSARSRFNRAAHYRSTMLEYEIIPLLQISNLPADRLLAQQIMDRLISFNNIYTKHLEKWTIQRIVSEWKSYRRTAYDLIYACRQSTPSEQLKIDIFLRDLPPALMMSRA